jgi:hypothetical protein
MAAISARKIVLFAIIAMVCRHFFRLAGALDD